MNYKTEITSYFHNLASRGLPMSVHIPANKTERCRVAVLAVHTGHYIMSFPPVVEIARNGFIAAGAPQLVRDKPIKERLLDVKAALEYVRTLPGVEKVVLMGHSQGGCILSCYQYIAENGTDRFKNLDRFLPFPDIEPLPPADGLMLVDTNYGFMNVLSMDPAVKDITTGYGRIPELDIYNPENGYDPAGSKYTQEFIARFQKAQVEFYENRVLALAKQRYEDIRLGKGKFCDDEPILIAGGGGGSRNNKLFMQDNSLLSYTRGEHPLLHNGGTVTVEVARTCRPMVDAASPLCYRGGSTTLSVNDILENEYRFLGDFGYDGCSMWGVDWNFNHLSSQANVKGISVPLLCEGNMGSHEFINIEYSYENAKSEDKSVVFLEGAQHELLPVKSAEKHPGEFGDPAVTFGAYAADWLGHPGRFIN